MLKAPEVAGEGLAETPRKLFPVAIHQSAFDGIGQVQRRSASPRKETFARPDCTHGREINASPNADRLQGLGRGRTQVPQTSEAASGRVCATLKAAGRAGVP